MKTVRPVRKMGWLKKSIMSVSAAILTAAVIGVPAFADSLMTDADADICGEDECIGIYDGTYRSAGGEGADQMIRYYDHRGNYIGSALGSIDYFGEPFKVLPKGALLKTYDADGGIILRTEDFGEVCRLPADDDYDRIVSESRSYIGVTDCAEGSFTVTGRDGETAAVLDIKALRSAVNMCQADIYEAEGYLYIGISGSDLSDNNPSGGDLSTYAAMVFDDGSVLTSDDPEFPEILPGKVCGALGKYLIIDEREDPDSGHDYSVVTSDGEVQLSNVNISERVREIATIKVLGFTPKEVDAYVNRESIILTMIGAVIGLVIGIYLHHLIMNLAEMDEVMFGRTILPTSYLLSFAMTMGFSFIINGIMHGKLKKIKMVESLKAVE